MAPPAEFSYGPTGADPDARFLARVDHGVQFPLAADQWRAVLPGLPWMDLGARGVGPQSRRLLPAGRNSGVVAEGGPYPRQHSRQDLEA